jgi:alkylated DNA nucleotide flippase Atl1
LSNLYDASKSISARVDRLYVKLASNELPQRVDGIDLIEGEGINTDTARSVCSPRQVLIVRKEDLDTFNLPVGYLKENFVISGLEAKDFQPGKLLQFNDGASVHLVFHCEPCKTIAKRVPNLKSIIGRRGLLGVVVQTGRVVTGAQCKSIASDLNAMPSSARERVCQVVSRIPLGKVLDYAALLKVAGLQRVYFRAIPNYLKAASASGLPAHRVVTSRFSIPEFMPDARQRLQWEMNIEQLTQHVWEPKILDLLSAYPLLTTSP